MPENRASLSSREQYASNLWDDFLWWLSTAEKELLVNCVVDRNRYKIVGATVLATWSFATLAWTYFWSTVINNGYDSVALGIFMGLIILTIDRALIKGINKFNKNKITPLLLRSVLAITLGTFMAQPAILFMFDKEIQLQASLDNEGRKRVKQQEMELLYKPIKKELNDKKAGLQKQLNEKYLEVSTLRKDYVAEIDGTGGSGKIGIKNIALAKQTEYEKADEEYSKLNTLIAPELSAIDSNLTSIYSNLGNENKAFSNLLNNGFLTRIEALNNLVQKSGALQWRYFLIVVILMLIELMPVLAKSLLPSGTYDEKVKLLEEMEREIAESNQLHEKELKQLYNALAKESDAYFLTQFFEKTNEDRRDKMNSNLINWKTDKTETFDHFWQKMKRDMLTKQEN